MYLEDIFEIWKERGVFLAANLNSSTLWTEVTEPQYFHHLKLALIDDILIDISSDSYHSLMDYLESHSNDLSSVTLDIRKGVISARKETANS